MPVDFNISRTGFAIRPASSGDEQACRMLLGAAAADAQQWVAVDGGHRLVVGAAALVTTPRLTPVAGYGALVHVIPPCRGKGIGRALLEPLQQAARELGGRALYAARRVDVGSDEMAGWRRLGFSICETVKEHELPLERFEPRLAPMLAWFRRHKSIPAEARIVPLFLADRQQVLQLHMAHLGGDRASLERRLAGQGEGAFHGRYSRVLLIGDRVIGCILAHGESPTAAVVDAVIVAPEYRGGWANVWLKLEATRGAQELGITHFRFATFDRYGDTRRFTEKFGGVTTRTSVLMYRAW
ncbi:MAG TPA: GNAT family N-acetyltransferase [Lacipirellula sp.]